jgi:hypothetical protein
MKGEGLAGDRRVGRNDEREATGAQGWGGWDALTRALLYAVAIARRRTWPPLTRSWAMILPDIVRASEARRAVTPGGFLDARGGVTRFGLVCSSRQSAASFITR